MTTLDLCLDLKNKRIDIENLLVDNEIKILCLQEVEVESNYDPRNLKLKNHQ